MLGYGYQVFILSKLLNRNYCGYPLSLHQIQEVYRRGAFGCSGCLRNLICLNLVRFTCVCKEHQIIKSRSHNQVFYKVVFSGGKSCDPLASALLSLVCVGRDSLDISKVRKCHCNLFFLNEILLIHFGRIGNDFGSSLVVVFFFDFKKLVSDYSHQHILI